MIKRVCWFYRAFLRVFYESGIDSVVGKPSRIDITFVEQCIVEFGVVKALFHDVEHISQLHGFSVQKTKTSSQ